MIAALVAAGVGFGLIYATWLFYLAIMNLQRAREAGSLTTWGLRFGYPLLMVGYLLDALSNIVVLTFILAEPPREWLVTARLSRHIKAGSGYRYNVAKWMCGNLLDGFDPSGCHCK